MALSDTPVKVKKLMDLVKLGELPSWILMQDFTPKCIAGAVQRGNCQHYSEDVSVKEAGGLWDFYGAGSLCDFQLLSFFF